MRKGPSGRSVRPPPRVEGERAADNESVADGAEARTRVDLDDAPGLFAESSLAALCCSFWARSDDLVRQMG